MLKFNLKSILASAMMLTTALAGQASITLQSSNPADNDEITSLTSVETTWNVGGNTTIEYDWNIPIQILDGNFTPLCTAFLVQHDENDITKWDVKFYSEAGAPYSEQYFVSIPTGALKGDMDAESKDALLFFYNVGGSSSGGGDLATINYTVPADGATVTEIRHLDTYWNGIDGDYSAGSMVQVRDADNNIVAKGDLVFDWNDPTFFTVDFNNTITAPGTYRIVFPEGALNNEYGDPKSAAYEMTLIIAGASGGDYALKFGHAVPADGSTVTALPEVKLVFPDCNMEWTLDTDASILLKDAAGNTVATGRPDYDWDDETAVIITFNGSLTPGNYTVEIPAGLLNKDNEQSEPVTLHYTIAGASGASFTFDSCYPNDGATVNYNDGANLGTINVTYNSGSLTLTDPSWIPALKKDGTEEFPGTVVVFMNNTLIFNFDGADDFRSGSYTLEIPAGKFTANGMTNEGFSATWNYIQDKNLQEPVVEDPEPLVLEVLKLTDGTNEIDLLGNGVKLAEIPAEPYELVIGTNKNYKSESLVVSITDLQDPEFGNTKWTMKTSEFDLFGKKEDGLFHFYYAQPIKLTEGHTYKINIEAFRLFDGIPAEKRQSWNASFVYVEGLTPEYKYSDVEIVDVTPAPGSELDEINDSFTVTYSAPVDIVTDPVGLDAYGQEIIITGLSHGFYGHTRYESITPNADKTAWTFKISNADIMDAAGGLLCNVAANDANGLRVRPASCSQMGANPTNNGEEERATQMYSFVCFAGNDKLEVAPGEGIVTELYEFEFTAPTAAGQEIAFTGTDSEGHAINGTIRSNSGARVATLDRDDLKFEFDKPSGDDQKIVKVIMHLDKKITAPGNYILDLPSCLFATGSQYSSTSSPHQQFRYTIEGDIALDAASIKDNSIVRELGIVAIYSGDAVELGDDARMVLRRKGSTREVTSAPLNVSDAGSYFRVYADFSDPENGYAAYQLATGYDYELVVAEGAIKQYPSGTPYVEKIIPFSCPELADVETVTLDVTIAGHAMSSNKIAKGQTATVTLTPAEGWKVESVKFNGNDVTADVKNGSYTTPALNTNSTLDAEYAYNGNLAFADESTVAQIEGSNIKVSVVGSDIIVNGVAKGDRVDVYSISGSHIAGHDASDEAVRITVNGGIYVVTINGKNAVKVIVK